MKKDNKAIDIIKCSMSGIDEGPTLDNMICNIFKNQFKDNITYIHIEPVLNIIDENSKNAGFIRYRIDGNLEGRMETNAKDLKTGKIYKKIETPIPSFYDEIIDRIKEISGIKNENDNLSILGKLKIYCEDIQQLLEYKVSVLPQGDIIKGGKEKIVLKKIDRSNNEYLDLKKINMDEDKRIIIDEIVGTKEKAGKFNNGLILTTGPRGSGKTTTLFSILNQINSPTINIQTLENPIEYIIPGINQLEVMNNSSSYTYDKLLKASLEQDLDVVLVGEIRDKITMDAIKEAVDTGHLIFSSLYTNDTYKTLEKLESLGFDLKLIGNTIRLIIAERLGKMTCPKCMKEYNDPIFSTTLEDATIREKRYMEMKMDIVRKLLDSPYVMDLPDNIEDIKLYEGVGGNCVYCRGKKTLGSCGIYEFLETSDKDVINFISKFGTFVDNETIKNELFIPKDITTLHQNALIKTVKGIKTYNGDIRYISYDNALASVGIDTYEWGRTYKNASLEELNLLLKEKKARRQINNNLEKIKSYKLQIDIFTKNINKVNKEKNELQIKELKKELKELEKQNKKLQTIFEK